MTHAFTGPTDACGQRLGPEKLERFQQRPLTVESPIKPTFNSLELAPEKGVHGCCANQAKGQPVHRFGLPFQAAYPKAQKTTPRMVQGLSKKIPISAD
jgi:hypothetical protein